MEPTKPRSTATAYRRQKQIEDCLYKNMMHTPYQSISVSDICRQVGISRKAFYNYYHDKDTCLCAIIDRVLQDSFLHVSANTQDSTTPLEAATVLLDYWKTHRSFYDILLRNNLLHFLLLRNMNYILNEDQTILSLLNTSEVKSDQDILACFLTSQLTLVLQWYLRSFDTPTEEMAKKLLRIIHAPMLQAPEEGEL